MSPSLIHFLFSSFMTMSHLNSYLLKLFKHVIAEMTPRIFMTLMFAHEMQGLLHYSKLV